MAFLEIDRLNKQFPNRQGETVTAVSDFNLHVEQGEFISLLGPSGCGKTTALRMVAGFERPTTGTIRLNGKEITASPPNQRNVGMVFQSYALFPNMTVADNVAFGLKLKGKSAADTRQRVAELLELIKLPDKGKSYPYQLSGGQQQRVALARALAIEPQVLLLDEPLSALDAKIRVELRGEIRRIQQQLQMTTIYVTHDQEEGLSLSDRMVVMNKGVIEQVGTPFEVYNFPTTEFAAHFVGHLNMFPVEVLDPISGRGLLAQQPITVDCPLPTANGNTVMLALRPEELRLGENNEANNVIGVVESVTFLGSIVRVRLKVGAQSLIADLFNERQLILPQVGDTITVNFGPYACWLLNRSAAA
jgi:putative spermidine/putrescine transport system ATP-binding protein